MLQMGTEPVLRLKETETLPCLRGQAFSFPWNGQASMRPGVCSNSAVPPPASFP